MLTKIKNNIFISLAVVILASIPTLTLAVTTWTGPSDLPPRSNLPQPVYTSGPAQIRTGDLTINGNLIVSQQLNIDQLQVQTIQSANSQLNVNSSRVNITPNFNDAGVVVTGSLCDPQAGLDKDGNSLTCNVSVYPGPGLIFSRNNSTGYGVYGESRGYGVFGVVPAGSVRNGSVAVYGVNNSGSGWGGYFNGGIGTEGLAIVADGSTMVNTYASQLETGDMMAKRLCLPNSGAPDCKSNWQQITPWQVSSSNVYFNAGNVGIGNSAPSQLLSVGSANNFTIDNGGAVTVNGTPANGAQINSGDVPFYINGQQDVQIRIDSNNNSNNWFKINNGANQSVFMVHEDGMTDVGQRLTQAPGQLVVNNDTNGAGGSSRGLIVQNTNTGNVWPTIEGRSSYNTPDSRYVGLALYRQANAVNDGIGVSFGLGDSSNVLMRINYAKITGNIESPTANATAGNLRFYTTENNSVDSEKMRIMSNGNVGIGTTNPTAKLDVSGSANISGTLNIGYEVVTAGSQTGAASATASCSSGKKVIGGGASCYANTCTEGLSLVNNAPTTDNSGWVGSCRCKNGFGSVVSYAICARIN